MSRPIVEAALARIAKASLPDTYIVAARYTMPDDPEEAAFDALHIFRSGGAPMSQAKMEHMLTSRNSWEIEPNVSPFAVTIDRYPWVSTLPLQHDSDLRHIDA